MTSTLAIDGGTPVRSQMLVFGAPVLGEDEYGEVLDTLKSGWIGTGPKTIAFEREFVEYIGANHAVAVSSCTAALHLSLISSAVSAGDEVITTPLTFAATANTVVHQNATPVFVDIDPNTLNIDPRKVEQAISKKTKAIIPVHFGGLACPLEDLYRIAEDHRLAVIEDAAHAVGSKHDGRMIGSFGNLTCFSFYANKNLTTGEGGMVVTDDHEAAELISIYRLHGMNRDAWQRYRARKLVLSDVVEPGYKYNMTDLQASLGIHQLRKQEKFLEQRERLARLYDDAIAGVEGVCTQYRPNDGKGRHALHLYVLILDPEQFRVGRDQIVAALIAENIGAAIHYKALHLHPYYRERFGYKAEDFPVAARVGDNILSLPLTPAMTADDVHDVVDAVKKVLAAYRR